MTITTLTTAFGWQIRLYPNGNYDAVQVDGPGLSPGFTSHSEALKWVAERRTIARAQQNNDPSALRRAFS